MSYFEKCFMESLRKAAEGYYDQDDEELCRPTYRRDKHKRRVTIPYRGKYAEGPNGRGIGVEKGHTTDVDDLGQAHSIPPGMVMRKSSTGAGYVMCPTASYYEKDGKLIIRESQYLPRSEKRMTFDEVLERMERITG